MERNIPSLLLILLVFFILSAPPCAESTVSNISKVVLIRDLKTWVSALSHCREFHDDLVTITNQQEADEFLPYEGWIGLRWVSGDWRWSSGNEKVKFVNWDVGEPRFAGCVWKRQSHLEWENDHCNVLHPFMCDERLDLTQEKKTWEEALEHCREKDNYDLVSLLEADTFLLNREQATTNEVWIGLRFLAGEWWWMNGHRAKSSDLPHCPAQQQHCGALLPNEKGWKIMNCSEKRNFLCSKIK